MHRPVMIGHLSHPEKATRAIFCLDKSKKIFNRIFSARVWSCREICLKVADSKEKILAMFNPTANYPFPQNNMNLPNSTGRSFYLHFMKT